MGDMTTRELTDEFTMDVGYGPVPFFEDENNNLTGLGHQDKKAFAAAVNRYDEWVGEVDLPLTRAVDVEHRWVRLDEDPLSEMLLVADEGDPGAIPVTTIWGQR